MTNDTLRPDAFDLPDGVRVVQGGFELPCSKKTNCPKIAFPPPGEEGGTISEYGDSVVFENDDQLRALAAVIDRHLASK